MKMPCVDPSAFYNLIGKTLIAVQSLDYSLCHYLVLWTHTTRVAANKLLEDSLQKTLGQLLKALDKGGLTPEGLGPRLDSYRENRNWFVHRLYAENWEDLYNEERAQFLQQRVAATYGEAKALIDVFISLNEQWCLAHGVTPEQIQKALDDKLVEYLSANKRVERTGGPRHASCGARVAPRAPGRSP